MCILYGPEILSIVLSTFSSPQINIYIVFIVGLKSEVSVNRTQTADEVIFTPLKIIREVFDYFSL